MGLRRLFGALLRDRAKGSLVQLFRYGVVSVVSLGVDFGGLWVLTEAAGLHYLLSAIVSYGAGMLVNYGLSVLWVFPTRKLKSRAVELGAFVAIGLAGMGINEALLWLLTDVLRVHYLASRAVSAVVGFVWKFVARKVALF
jgi:putative flippase GtrA